jgi:hypothetical protein
MELSELKSIWQAYDTKLEKSLKLNLHCLEVIQSQKVKSKLKPLLWLRIAEVILHSIVIIWLAGFLIKNIPVIQYVLAASALILFFAIAFANGIKQISLLKEIDNNEDILTIQKKLTLLQSHIADYIRLTFLCMPTYLAYPIIAFKVLGNFDIVSKLSHNWWMAQLAFTIILIPVCIWLYSQVTYRNIHKKWVKYIIEKSAGTRISKAMEFVKDIDDMKKGNI